MSEKQQIGLRIVDLAMKQRDEKIAMLSNLLRFVIELHNPAAFHPTIAPSSRKRFRRIYSNDRHR